MSLFRLFIIFSSLEFTVFRVTDHEHRQMRWSRCLVFSVVWSVLRLYNGYKLTMFLGVTTSTDSFFTSNSQLLLKQTLEWYLWKNERERNTVCNLKRNIAIAMPTFVGFFVVAVVTAFPWDRGWRFFSLKKWPSREVPGC